MPALSLTIQTGTLYASNDSSTFVGTGGPWGFSPYTSQFGGVVSSAGLAGEPFDDTVYSVATGDEVIFVIALQNTTAGSRAYDVGLHANLPAGFVAPADGTNLSVTDGAGTDLAFTGDLFGPGIRLSGPIPGYDPDSGQNVVLVTYTLAAGANLPGPYATVVSTVSTTHTAASAGGVDLGIAAGAATTVVTAAPTPTVRAETSAAAVAKGQAIAFDVSIAIPAGTMRDVRLDTLLPGGASRLNLVSATVTGVGAGLQLGTPVIGTDGGVRFGTIASSGNASGNPADNVITLRVVVQADGTVSGNAVLNTVLSSATSDGTGRWSATVGSSVGVVVPPDPPGIAGIWTGQQASPGVALHPLGGLVLTDNDLAATATLAVTLRDPSLGRLSGPGGAGSFDAAGSTFIMSGALAALQAAARALMFRPGVAGTEHLTVTLVDAGGGIAQDDGTSVVGTGSGPGSGLISVAGNSGLWLADLNGTFVLRGPGAILQADHVTGTPGIAGFGTTDRLVLPATSSALSYVQSGSSGLLSVGGTSLVLLGIYDASWLQAAAGDPGSVIVSFRPDPLFDPAYYLASNPDVAAAAVDPLQHYLTTGWREGRTPLALFDTNYYLVSNPDVAAAGVNPLLHFESSGWREGRNPSAAFSERDYLAAYTDVRAAGLNPLLHYLQFGRGEGRAAFAVSAQPLDPLVDLAAYYAGNPDVRAAGANANAHYLAIGWREGRNPDAFFDSSYYLSQNPDVRAAGVNPLLHFEAIGWIEGRQPSLLFDDAKYLAANPDVRAAGFNPLLHFLQGGQAEGRASYLVGGTAPVNPLVDAAYYDAQLGATLLPAGAVAAQQAAWSYDSQGWAQGLNPSTWFDTRYYLLHNPDVAAAHVDPLLHYESVGWTEGRNPSASFDTRKYLQANPDVRDAAVNPLIHYVTNGAAEGRAIFPA